MNAVSAAAHPSYAVNLRDLLQARPLAQLQVKFQSGQSTRVQDLALVTEVEEVMAVRPDTVVLLANELSAGSWIVSAALHYAWERRACAVVAPSYAITAPAIEIARRLDITLIAADRDVTRLCIEMAIQLGIARAEVISHVQALAERLANEQTLSAMLELLSQELQGARVQLSVGGTVIVDVAGDAQMGAYGEHTREEHMRSERADPRPVSVQLIADETDTCLAVQDIGELPRDYVEQLLRSVAPSLRALLYRSRLEAMLQSLPTVSLGAMTGVRDLSLLDAPSGAGAAVPLFPLNGQSQLVCILPEYPEVMGAMVHQIWQQHFPAIPLGAFTDGWLAIVPAAAIEAGRPLATAIRDCFTQAGVAGVAIGISRPQTERERVAESVREAWIAARVAAPRGTVAVAVMEFERITWGMLDRLLPPSLAHELLTLLAPEFLCDPQVKEMIDAVLAFLSAKGSASRAAELLQLHRNTVQARIHKAEQLGLPLSNPDQLLSTFVLLSAVQGALHDPTSLHGYRKK